MDVSDYKTLHDGYVMAFVEDVFNAEKLTEKYDNYYKLIIDYTYEDEMDDTFLNSNDDFD